VAWLLNRPTLPLPSRLAHADSNTRGAESSREDRVRHYYVSPSTPHKTTYNAWHAWTCWYSVYGSECIKSSSRSSAPSGRERPGAASLERCVRARYRPRGYPAVAMASSPAGDRAPIVTAGVITTPNHRSAATAALRLGGRDQGPPSEFRPDVVASSESSFKRTCERRCPSVRRAVLLSRLRPRAAAKVVEYTSNEVKQCVAATAAAEKRQVQRMVQRLLSLPKMPDLLMWRTRSRWRFVTCARRRGTNASQYSSRPPRRK